MKEPWHQTEKKVIKFVPFKFSCYICKIYCFIETAMKLRFDSYKRFASPQEIEIRPITIMIGKNNSGKSSVLKLLASFLRSLKGETPYPGINLGNNNGGFSLGPSFESICHNGNMVDLSLGMDLTDDVSLDVTLFKSPKNEVAFHSYNIKNKGKIVSAALDTSSGKMRTKEGHVSTSPFYGLYNRDILSEAGLDKIPEICVDYIGPLRAVPDRIWYMNNVPRASSGAGYDGTNAYNLICARPEMIGKLNEWFVDNMEGCRLSIEKGPEDGSFLIKVKHDLNDDYGVNIADTGMGINQVLPIVVSALNADGPEIVAIEQPELHLHPAAHAAIGRLMAKSAKDLDKRFVVETHSANLLLGIREAVVDKDIPLNAKDVIIYFFDDDDEGAYMRPITVTPDGNLSSWPTGIFGEANDLLKSIQHKAYINQNSDGN